MKAVEKLQFHTVKMYKLAITKIHRYSVTSENSDPLDSAVGTQKYIKYIYQVGIPVCLDPHMSHFLPSLESLYSSATETHRNRLMVGTS